MNTITKSILILLGVIVMALLVYNHTSVKEVEADGKDSVYFETGGDAYAGFNIGNITGPNKDVFAIAEVVTIAADDIQGDVTLLAGTIILNETLQGDLRAAGKQIIINGRVNDNTLISAESLLISSEGAITDEALIWVQSLTIAGAIDNAKIYAGEITITDTAVIGGDVVIVADEEDVSISNNATVLGSITITQDKEKHTDASFFDYHIFIYIILATLFAGLLGHLLGKRLLPQPKEKASTIVKLFALGIALPIALILCSIVAFVLQLYALGVTLLFGCVALYTFAFLLAPLFVGMWVEGVYGKSSPFWNHAIVGGLIVALLIVIPYTISIVVILTLIIVGHLLSNIYHYCCKK